jgi:TrmH family RNA methyltransferase
MPAVRSREGIVFIEGRTLALDALQRDCEVVAVVQRHGDEVDGLRELAREHNAPFLEVAAKGMEKLSVTSTPPDCGVLARPPRMVQLDAGGLPERLLVMDGISDPGNAGTLIRAAAGMGFRVAPIGGVSLSNEKMLRASAGSAFQRDLLRELPADNARRASLAGAMLFVALAPGAGVPLREALEQRRGRPVAIIVGNESRGIDLAAWPGAVAAQIPMQEDIESLNAAVSGAIAMYEVYRTSP